MTPFRGVLTAMVTPFAEDRSLDVAGARKLASYLVENGSHGVVVAGTTGEGPTLSDDETIELLEAVLDEIGPDATVICGTGSNDTRHAADLTHRAAQAGAHGVLVVSPYYNKPIEDGLREHYAEVSEAAGETPVCLYNIPSRSVINMSPEFMGSLAKEFQNITGLKQANNGDLKPIEGLSVLAGNDDVFSRCLREGGTGGILVASHVVGPQMREIFDAASEDDHDRALEIERELSDVYSAIAASPPASSIKAILSMRGMIGEAQRLPMVPVAGPARDALGDRGPHVMSKVKILPLGGLGEIGKNMTAIESEGRIVIVDAGVMFPTAEMLGIDLVLPDFTSLRDRKDDIDALVLTHGHEDHVGAVPYVLRELGIPEAIYGGPLTLGLVRSKLEERKIRDAPLRVLEPGERVQAGAFEIETIHMSHSIPDARAVALHTKLGTILITGDYRFDQTPVDGQPADIARLAELGSEGVLCLCGDSTNADRPGVGASERSVGPALREVFSRCEGRIIVTCFASNVHRVQQVIDAAVELDRKVALVGRSMRKNFNIASNLGMANAPAGVFINPKEIENYPDDRVIAISTGSQGEPLSALRRMAFNDHRDVELHSGDTIIFSATAVPGNERAVNETIDRIYEIGATVVTAADAPIHVSGHGSREELKLMLNLTRPKYVMPFHGDHKRIRLHAELAESVGIPPERIFRGRNGLALEIDEEGARFTDDVDAGMIFVDGVDIGDPDDVALRDRRTLSGDGVLIVVATLSSEDGATVAEPEIIFRGVPFIEGDGAVKLIGEIRDAVANALADAVHDDITDAGVIQEDIHDDVAELIYKRLKRRPMILPVVVEV